MKTLRFLGSLVIGCALIPSLTACGGDDDDDDGGNGGGGNNGGGSTTIIQGERLSSVAGFNLSYDNKGRLCKISPSYDYSSDNDALIIDYAKGKIYEADSDGDPDGIVYNIKFNGKGYVSELSASYDYIDEDGGDEYRIKGSGKITFSYNGDGNLTGCYSSMSETEKDLEDGETSKYSETVDTKLTWANGNLISAKETDIEIEDGEKDTYRTNYNVQYNGEENRYRQFVFGLSYIPFDDTEWQIMAAAGLFGKGTAEVPVSLSESDDEGEHTNHSFWYTFNENGSIASERANYGNTIYWGYSDNTTKSLVPAKKLSLSNIFRAKRKARK